MLKIALLFILMVTNCWAEISALPLAKALKTGVDPYQAYLKINDTWRDLADKTPGKIAELNFFSSDEKAKLLENKEINSHFEDLIAIGKIRSRYITYLYKERSTFIQDGLDRGLISDIVREVKIIPMRWLGNGFLFVLEIKNELTSGFHGIKRLAIMVFKFLLVFILPILAIWGVRKWIEYLKKEVKTLNGQRFKSSKHYRKYKFFLGLEKYSKWPLYYVVFGICQSEFEAYAFWFLAGQLFVTYKFFFLITKNLFESLFSRDAAHNGKADTDAKLISRIVFLSYFFLLFSESIIGRGISFFIIKEGTFWALVLVSTLVLARWNQELAVIVENYNWGKFSSKLSGFLKQKTYFFLALPVFVLVLLTRMISWTGDFLERFDFFKKITAQLFKKKLESSEHFEETDLNELPEAYIEAFEQTEEVLPQTDLIGANKEVLENINDRIDEWLENPLEENSIALYGDKGCGKSTILKLVSERNEEKTKVLRVTLEHRYSNATSLLKKIEGLLDVDITDDLTALIKKDKELTKTIIIIDSTQNIFLSHMSGFEAYKAFSDLINLRLENIFFIAAFNSSSWRFLQTVFQDRQSFRFIMEVKGWSEDQIRELIMKRHNTLEYKLSFARILRAIQGNFDQDALANAEEQFFRILWEQSLGNPRVALYLWLSALHFDGKKLLSVGLPHSDELSALDKLGDDSLFVYAAVVRHENLSAKEATKVTNINESSVRYALKIGLENNFLFRRKNGQYTFNTRFQYTLLKFLTKKNFILGK